MANSGLVVDSLVVEAQGKEILHGVTLHVALGEVVAIMGPNGSGKSTLSHTIMGRPGYRITGGSITFDGVDVTHLPTEERSLLGLSIISQYPEEIPGVSAFEVVEAALHSRGLGLAELSERLDAASTRVELPVALLERAVNVDMSGGEKKRMETLILSMLPTKVAILDEIDSGLDIDALRSVARRIRDLSSESGMAVLAITHYSRLLKELVPSRILVLSNGIIVEEGGPELSDELERVGYTRFEPEVTGDRTPFFPF